MGAQLPDWRSCIAGAARVSHTTVKPVKLRLHNTDLACDVSRVVAYQGRCACGWVGPSRSAVSVAREDGRIHRATCER
jgi:hypothetical protein